MRAAASWAGAALDIGGHFENNVDMNVTLKDAARLLQVSEKTLYRWIQKDVLPAYQRRVPLQSGGARRVGVGRITGRCARRRCPRPPRCGRRTCGAAHQRGGIYYRVGGRSREQVLDAVTLPGIPRHIDTALLIEMLRTREQLASTVGGGIAIPPSAQPAGARRRRADGAAVLPRTRSFGALDGKKRCRRSSCCSARRWKRTCWPASPSSCRPSFRKLLDKQAASDAILAALRPAGGSAAHPPAATGRPPHDAGAAGSVLERPVSQRPVRRCRRARRTACTASSPPSARRRVRLGAGAGLALLLGGLDVHPARSLVRAPFPRAHPRRRSVVGVLAAVRLHRWRPGPGLAAGYGDSSVADRAGRPLAGCTC